MELSKDFTEGKKYRLDLMRKTFSVQEDTTKKLQKFCRENNISLSLMVDKFLKKKLLEIESSVKEGGDKI